MPSKASPRSYEVDVDDDHRPRKHVDPPVEVSKAVATNFGLASLEGEGASSLRYRGQRQPRLIYDKTTANIHLPGQKSPINLRFWLLCFSLFVAAILASMGTMTFLMWRRIMSLETDFESRGAIRHSFPAGHSIRPGSMVSLVDNVAYPGLGLDYQAPLELRGPLEDSPTSISMDSTKDSLVVTALYPSADLYVHTFTWGSDGWSGSKTEVLQRPAVDIVYHTALLSESPRRALWFYTVVAFEERVLMAEHLTWHDGDTTPVSRRFILQPHIPIEDTLQTTIAKVKQDLYVGVLLTWATKGNWTCQHLLFTQNPDGQVGLSSMESPMPCYSHTGEVLASISLGESSMQVAVVSHTYLTTIEIDLASRALQGTPVRVFRDLTPSHAAGPFKLALWDGALVIVAGTGPEIAIWVAELLAAGLGIGDVALRALIPCPRKVSLVDVYAVDPAFESDPQRSGVFVIFLENGALVHNAVRLRLISGSSSVGIVTPSDIVQAVAPYAGLPAQAALIPGSQMAAVLFSSAPLTVAAARWRGGLVVAGVSTSAAEAGQNVTVQMQGPAVLAESSPELLPGMMYYGQADGALTHNQYLSSLPSGHPLGMAVGGQELRVCLTRAGGSRVGTIC